MSPIDYDAVLEDLRAKRDELNTAIAAIERIRGGAPSTGPSSLPNGDVSPSHPPANSLDESAESRQQQVREDSFFGLSATAAARKYLMMVKRPVLTQEFVDALRKGGYLTNATNFYSNLYTTLKRSPEFTNLGRGKWGLTEWYPNRPRKRKGGAVVDEPDDGESI